jgi:hypothetical protein
MSEPATDISGELELLCPLCDYNLRGLEEPRCPECGHRFEWDALRESITTKHPYLFEHHNGRMAFVRTWSKSLWPRRFWSKLHTTHEPNRRRLMKFGIAQTLLASVLLLAPVCAALVQGILRVRAARASWVARVNLGAPPAFINQMIARFGSIQNAAAATIPYRDLFRDFLPYAPGSPYPPVQCVAISTIEIILLWPVLTYLTLMFYREVLRQAKIRDVHVLRVAIYSAAPIVFIGPLMCVIWLINDTSWPALYDFFGWLPTSAVLIDTLLMSILTYRVIVACRLYLRLPLLTIGALLTQMLVWLALIRLYLFLVLGRW